MATIQELKTKIENANALGRTNLAEKGVKLSETATTYDIMSKIAEVSGGGTEYTSIVYNTDNTVTLTDKDGVVHTMSCIYGDGKLIGVTYDGKAVELTYNGDALVKVGNTVVDMANVPKQPLTTIKADSSVVEVILPVIVPTVTAEINNGTIVTDSSASLEV